MQNPSPSSRRPFLLTLLQDKPLNSMTDVAFFLVTGACALVIFVILGGILLSLSVSAWPAIQKFGLGFLGSREWNPVTQEFGALTSIHGTLMSTLVAMFLAVPASAVIAMFLVELAPPRVGQTVGYLIELLAAIPSIIYGMWGLFVFAPFVSKYVQPFLHKTLGFLPFFRGPMNGIGTLTGGIILALMILPFMTAVIRDVFRMVPSVVKESAYGMGATTSEVTLVTLRYGAKGILGAAFLGLGRAIGETMAITFVIGNRHEVSWSLFDASNSIASTLANEFAEASEKVYLAALIELGLVLFVITLAIQVVAQWWLGRVERSMGGQR